MDSRARSPGRDTVLVLAGALATFALTRHFANPRLTELPNPETNKNPPVARRMNWWTLLKRTWKQVEEDRLLATAAGVVFFGLLAIFPAVTVLVSGYGLFADPASISSHLQSLALLLPQGSFEIVQDQISRVTSKDGAALGFAAIGSLALAVWSANAGTKAIIDALNVVYDEVEKRSFVRLNLISLTLTIGGLAVILLMVAMVVALPVGFAYVGLERQAQLLVFLGRWPVLLIVILTAFALLYRFGPSRSNARFQLFSVGSVVASALWISGSALLSWYLANFGDYTATYGSLGAAIGLMMWMWMSTVVVLVGAELNSESESMQFQSE